MQQAAFVKNVLRGAQPEGVIRIRNLVRTIEEKFGTEPIAQEPRFTKSSKWLAVMLGCPRTPRGTTFNY